MEHTVDLLGRRIRQGWVLLGLGALLLAGGIALSALLPGGPSNFKWVEGFGIWLLGWGSIHQARYLLAARDPSAARRAINEDLDERNIAISRQAGHVAFVVTILAAGSALIVHSAMTRGSPYDALWWFLAAAVVVPSAVYVVAQFFLRNRQ
jgi:hypothetical protein